MTRVTKDYKVHREDVHIFYDRTEHTELPKSADDSHLSASQSVLGHKDIQTSCLLKDNPHLATSLGL